MPSAWYVTADGTNWAQHLPRRETRHRREAPSNGSLPLCEPANVVSGNLECILDRVRRLIPGPCHLFRRNLQLCLWRKAVKLLGVLPQYLVSSLAHRIHDAADDR